MQRMLLKAVIMAQTSQQYRGNIQGEAYRDAPLVAGRVSPLPYSLLIEGK